MGLHTSLRGENRAWTHPVNGRKTDGLEETTEIEHRLDPKGQVEVPYSDDVFLSGVE